MFRQRVGTGDNKKERFQFFGYFLFFNKSRFRQYLGQFLLSLRESKFCRGFQFCGCMKVGGFLLKFFIGGVGIFFVCLFPFEGIWFAC